MSIVCGINYGQKPTTVVVSISLLHGRGLHQHSFIASMSVYLATVLCSMVVANAGPERESDIRATIVDHLTPPLINVIYTDLSHMRQPPRLSVLTSFYVVYRKPGYEVKPRVMVNKG